MISTDPQQAAGELAGWAEQLQQKAQKFQELHAQMTAASVTLTSPEGRVRVTVDGNGLPSDLTLTASSRGADPAELSAELMRTVKQAQAQLSAEVTNMVRESVGDDPAGATIIDQYQERFAADDETSVENPDEDEYFGRGSILDDGDDR